VHDKLLLLVRGTLERERRDEAVGDLDERLLGPRQEVVDRRDGEHAGELAGADREERVEGTEAQDDVQVVADPVDEELPQVVLRLLLVGALLLEHAREVAVDGQLLVLGDEAGHLTREQHRVEVLEEVLVLDLRVGKQERHLLTLVAGDLVHHLQILHQRGDTVGFRELDLEGERPADVRRKLGERLLAGPAYTDEHGGAAGHFEDTGDAHEVAHGVGEEYEVHGHLRVLLVVLGQEGLRALPDLRLGPAALVHLGSFLD